MLYKSRTKTEELLILEYLAKRMSLPDQERNYYLSLKKGFEGELVFDTLTEKLEFDCLVFNDLLLNNNKTTFQIDTVILSSNKVYLYEVKNYEGDYLYENDKFIKLPNSEIPNPLNQLRRAETLLKQLLTSLGSNLPVEGLVVFINPEFTLYQSPLNYPFLFPTQIKRYLQKLDASTSKLTYKHRVLADKLVSMHYENIKDNKYSNVPVYRYEDLRKGIPCEMCGSFFTNIVHSNCICNTCSHVEKFSNSVLRSVEEFKVLFPKEKITTNTIYEWCKIVDSKRRIRRILEKNFKTVGKSQWTYYE